MRLEIILLLITGFIIYNIYYDWKYLKMFYSYKKYFTIGIVVILSLSIYLLIKRDPLQSKKILLYANNMIKYMPIDKQSMNLISPIIDFTTTKKDNSFMIDMNKTLDPQNFNIQKPVKRSVSETKKKFVASQQQWRCGNCKNQLNHTFEIDHKMRLEYGGTNDINNLIALCRNCHGEKTARENM
jgi:hypothetical protein